MTNKSKVAELLEGVEADAERVDFKYAGRDIDSHFFVPVGEACKHVDESLIKKISLLYPTATIECVFGPVLAALEKELDEAQEELNCAEAELDSAICDLPESGQTSFDCIGDYIRYVHKTMRDMLVRSEEQNARLSQSCADLQATKDDYYRNGVAQGLSLSVEWIVELPAAKEYMAARQAVDAKDWYRGFDDAIRFVRGQASARKAMRAPQPPVTEPSIITKDMIGNLVPLTKEIAGFEPPTFTGAYEILAVSEGPVVKQHIVSGLKKSDESQPPMAEQAERELPAHVRSGLLELFAKHDAIRDAEAAKKESGQ